MKTIKIYPKCHPYNYDENSNSPPEKEWRRQKTYVYAAQGYLLPCCWCGWADSIDEFKDIGMIDESLKVENVESLKDIFLDRKSVV